MTFTKEQISQLTAKLDMAHVKPPTQFGPKGDYLEGWLVIAEANRIFGFDGWSYGIQETKCVAQVDRKVGSQKRDGFGVTYTSKVRVEVGEVMREDFGAGHGYDVDLGLAHESAIKEAVTDALKRALRTFGNPFGLALYDKTRANVSNPEDEAREKAIDNLWQEIVNIQSLPGLKSFWTDNYKAIKAFGQEEYSRFEGKKDERKAVIETAAKKDDAFPGDTVTDEELRQHPINAG